MKTEPKAITSQNTEILWILIHIYRAKRKCKWYKLYLTDCGNQMVESVIQPVSVKRRLQTGGKMQTEGKIEY